MNSRFTPGDGNGDPSEDGATTVHLPVLATEVMEGLELQPGQTVVDGTLGGGGHTSLFLEAVGPTGLVISLDRDHGAIARAQTRFADVAHFRAIQSNFCDLADVLEELEVPRVDAILLDLGLSSDQLAATDRGFSFDSDGELDLRFDQQQGEPAWQLLRYLPEKELADVIYQFGEERYSRRIARQLVAVRRKSPIRTARELADLVRRCVPRSPGLKIHPATRTFQALRIAVNRELESLERALERFPQVLAPGGRLAVISFHSLEDRRVKQAFRSSSDYEILTKKPIRPNEAEIRRNPRSRSARLRLARRTTPSEPAH
jgi:16S rRNA (cytosine1402-N4)-methyltransferase